MPKQRDEQAIWEEFGRELRDLRQRRGWSVPELVERTKASGGDGVSRDQILKLEHGGYRKEAGGEWETPNPRDEKLAALATALGVDVQQWFRKVGRYEGRPRTRQHKPTGGADRRSILERLEAVEAEVRRLRERSEGQFRALREEGVEAPESAATPEGASQRPVAGRSRRAPG